ncbi:hypothetical protein HYR69_03860, partial [Candidatus Sumerlaeota bacterium]|nr:hypothetical protein [Candidatus Sumerlaeota bacterium]
LNATAANDHLTIYDNIGSNAACARFQNADTGTASTDGFQVGINASEEGVIWNLESNGILFGTAATQRMKIDGSGNVVIGDGSVAAGSGGSHVLAFQEGTTPSVVSSVPQLYAVQHANAIVELRGMDGAGNVNTLTPHNFSMLPPPDPSVELPWSYYSENPYIGVEQNVDLAGVVKAVEHLTGRQFVYSREMVPEKLQGWYANQMREKEQVEQARREEAMKEEIECPKEEALEPYPMTTRVSQTVQEVEYELDPASGQVIPKSVEKQVAQEVPTGQTGWRLKAGARLDPKTGKFYRHKTADEVTIEPYQIKDPPAWILERMQKHGRL